MPENNDEPDAQMLDAVLDAAECIVIDQATGRANYEKVADVFIEDNLGSSARVRACNHNGKRMLLLCRCRPPVRIRFAGADLISDKPLVAGSQAVESFLCC